MTTRRTIRTEEDLGEVQEMLADFNWLHFAVEDRNGCAYLVIEDDRGDLWATDGSEDEWQRAETILGVHGPLTVLQDLRPAGDAR